MNVFVIGLLPDAGLQTLQESTGAHSAEDDAKRQAICTYYP